MSLTPDQVETIRHCLPGWEDDWGQLCVILLGDGTHRGSLVRAVQSLRITWPSENERDDFIATVLEDFHSRARNGTLLLSYDPESGDVISFLTARHVLYVDAVKFLQSLAKRQSCSLDDPDFDPRNEPKAKPETRPDLSVADRQLSKLVRRLQEELEQLKLPESTRITRVVEQAGLQLYRRLDWSQPGMNCLRHHLLHVLRAPSDGTDPLAALDRAHELAKGGLKEQLEQISAQIYNEGRGVRPKRRKHLENRFANLCFERVFLPLDAPALVGLLGIKRADAAQRRHRYREQLPQLLPALRDRFNELECLRQEISQGKSV